MKRVFEALNLREGALLATFLEDHGIKAEVRGGAHHAVRGELANIRGGFLPGIYVEDERDAERASALIEEYFRMLREPAAGSPWTCPGCGEVLEPQFLSCWKCQAAKP
jgi:hypothetical protein